ncbi:MAG: MoxR family ATPase [Saprospiraceae bacterium]|nr:MoxR family ATPase [Saprospiraceae bacterium]
MSVSPEKLKALEAKAKKYIIHEALQNAYEVAVELGQPLLLTGEPGTGKTLLAAKVAYELSQREGSTFYPEVLEFNTKTSSTARDLFYTYDAISHFQTANIRRQSNEDAPATADFIELQALGKAIAFSNPKERDQPFFSTPLPKKPQSSVVLIDEIDKAPRDFTNDILMEIDKFSFAIKEQNNHRIDMDTNQQIAVIMTSNSEKNLPDAFLRRCVFYHIPFPSDDILLKIVKSQLGEGTKYTDQTLEAIIAQFNEVRENSVRKKPATAELLAWVRILELRDYLEANETEQKKIMKQNLSVLVKTQEDWKVVHRMFS